VHNATRRDFAISGKIRIALASAGGSGDYRRMTARRVATAQREAAHQMVAPQVTKGRITWGALGCPKEIGLYRAVGAQRTIEVRVKRIHILVADDNPQATFTVLTFRPPIGPAEYVLGHRVA
jgi:hypothetical protein